MTQAYFKRYFSSINSSLNSIELDKLIEISLLKKIINILNKKILFFGNGGSASIADHLTVDFINAVGIRAVNFNNSSIITCFSNDYGYKNWVSKALEYYADDGDIVVLISSSGQSKNMLVGAKKAKLMNLSVITLSGFSFDNPLRKMGDINLWVDSNAYNIVEMTHHVWLLSVADYIIKTNDKEDL